MNSENSPDRLQGAQDSPVKHPGARGPRGRANRGPTPQLRQAADELEERVVEGEPVTHEDLTKMRTLVALDLMRSSRPTARAKGLQLLEEVGDGNSSETAQVDETPF